MQTELIDVTTRDLVAAEIDTQIATAKQYPRDVIRFKREATELACVDEECAGSMFYVLKRGGKTIEGPSVRLAEVVVYSWGNIRTDTRVIAIDDNFVTAQATCLDLERNIAKRSETKRRITGSNGRRYNDDMIQVTANAAMAIALREAVFGVVPRSLFKDVYEEAKRVSVGKAGTNAEKIVKMFEWFTKTGATEDQVLAFLGKLDRESVDINDVITMRGVMTRIKDEGIPVEDALSDGTTKPQGNSKHQVAPWERGLAKELTSAESTEDCDAIFVMRDPLTTSIEESEKLAEQIAKRKKEL